MRDEIGFRRIPLTGTAIMANAFIPNTMYFRDFAPSMYLSAQWKRLRVVSAKVTVKLAKLKQKLSQGEQSLSSRIVTVISVVFCYRRILRTPENEVRSLCKQALAAAGQNNGPHLSSIIVSVSLHGILSHLRRLHGIKGSTRRIYIYCGNLS